MNNRCYQFINACYGSRLSALTAGHITIITLTSMETPKANPNDPKVITVCISGKYCEIKVRINIFRSAPKALTAKRRKTVLIVLEFC
jgi:hypothetical protein